MKETKAKEIKKIVKEKNVKGITLIALVITIIVLLILAGVSIATLTENNGIFTKAQEAKEKTEEAEAKEELELAIGKLKIDYYNGDKSVFNKEFLIDNLNNNLKIGKVEKANIYYDTNEVNKEKIDEIDPIYRLNIKNENICFKISEEGELQYLQKLYQMVQENDANGISNQAGKWVSYPKSYTNQSKDYDINGKLGGWRILNDDGEYTKIVTAGIPARYEYNHNKTIVDDWNNFIKFEKQIFTWGINSAEQLNEENLSIGIRSINYQDIKEVSSDMSYIPAYTNVAWGSEKWPMRLRGLIGCENEYIVASWQNQEYDSLYYITFTNDKYGMHLNSNGYLYYPGVRMVVYLNKNVYAYETEYFDGSSTKQPILIIL